MHILRCMGSKFCVKFQWAPLKFHTKFWTHSPQNMHFTVFSFCVWVTISLNCDVISLSETGPVRLSWMMLYAPTSFIPFSRGTVGSSLPRSVRQSAGWYDLGPFWRAMGESSCSDYLHCWVPHGMVCNTGTGILQGQLLSPSHVFPRGG